ncbi:hypothetical protein GCM10027258_62350 [Amycolatopsis stemonae]
MAAIAYATRERVKRALDSAQTVRNDAQVDQALYAATTSIRGLTHRTFYPDRKTLRFDWPSRQRARSYVVRLDANELASLEAMTAGGVTIPTADVLLYPNSGPPYTRVEISLASSSALSSGDTHQQAVAITGVYAGAPVDESVSGALVAPLDSSATAVTVTDSSVLGVGSLLRIDDERMAVTDKRMLSTGQTVQNTLAAQANATTVTVTDGTAYTPGEIVLLDAERMLIIDVAGNDLIVKRAWDGTVLATHTGSTVYAPRTLIVERGVLGTTTATHDAAAPILRWVPPALVENLAVAEALVTLGCEQAGYATQTRSGESARSVTLTIDDLRDRVYTEHGRKARTRAV